MWIFILSLLLRLVLRQFDNVDDMYNEMSNGKPYETKERGSDSMPNSCYNNCIEYRSWVLSLLHNCEDLKMTGCDC